MNRDKIKAIIGEFICSGGTSDAAKALRDRVSSEIADRILALEKEPEEEIEWEKEFDDKYKDWNDIRTASRQSVKDFFRQEMKAMGDEIERGLKSPYAPPQADIASPVYEALKKRGIS